MRVLLGDASSLTARQTATQLAASGHVVEVLTTTRRPAARWTRHVTVLHSVAPFRHAPLEWLADLTALLHERSFDALVPTHDHAALLAAAAGALGGDVGLPVPSFASLARVQDRVLARRLLAELGVAQPTSVVVESAAALRSADLAPSFVKHPVRRDAGAVQLATTRGELAAIADGIARDTTAPATARVVQAVVEGPTVTLQAVYDDAALVAVHAYEDVARGWRGATTHKRSLDTTTFRDDLARIGAALEWHGALTVKAVLTPIGPSYVDVVPHLVEPANAWHAGVDLLAPLLDLAVRRPASAPRATKPGVCTHQLVTALLGAVTQHHTRRAAVGQLWRAARHRGPYAHSTEELTPRRHDARASAEILLTAGAALVWPRGVRRRARRPGADLDALGDDTWRAIDALAPAGGAVPADEPAVG